MKPPVRITPPAPLLTLSNFKGNARIEHWEEDPDLIPMLEAAVEHLDGWEGVLGRCLVMQTWRQDFAFWARRMPFPFPNVSSATVTYRDTAGDAQEVGSSAFEIEETSRFSYLRFRDAFQAPSLYCDADYPISVEFDAGFGAPRDVPERLKRAALMLATHFEANRGVAAPVAMQTVPHAFESLIQPFKRRAGLS